MDDMCSRLKLSRIRESYREWIEKASREDMEYAEFLRGLLEEEIVAREEKGMRRRLKAAGFPFEKTMEQFDFSFRPELRRQVFLNYLSESFIKEGRSLCLIGPAGLGKTHLAVAIGIRQAMRGYDVCFRTVQDLMNRVLKANGWAGRQRELSHPNKCDLLVLDELGYLPQDPQVGPVVYELIASRYEKKAVIVTSNKSITDWGKVLHDTSLAAVVVDRIMHHGEVYYLSGQSYRLRGKKISGYCDLQEAVSQDPPDGKKEDENSDTKRK